jgi:hypothetical protein
MKRLNAQRTLWKVFSSGREALGLLQEMEEFIEAIALSPQWQKRFAGYWSNGKPGNRQGPAGHDIVLMIRLVLAQCVLGKDYRELAYLLVDSKALRQFLEIEYVEEQALPKFTTLNGWMNALPVSFLEEVNLEISLRRGEKKQEAEKPELEKPEVEKPIAVELKQWRSDASCVESNIHYPTDSSLLRDGLRWMYRWIERMREELGIRARLDSQEMSWEKGHRLYLEIVKLAKCQKKKERKKSYRRLIQHTERVVGHFRGHVRKGGKSGAFERIENPVQYARFRMMLEEWERLEPLIEKAMGQARQRVLKGNVIRNEDKLLSLWEEHTQVIVRGKVGKSAEFGHKVTIWENQAGRLICGGIYPKGNPSESQLLAAELKQLTAKGLEIKSVSLDRGYWDRTKLEEIEKATGIQMYCPKKGKKNAERAALEGSEEFRRQQRFRVGIEGTLSVLVRRHGFRRARLKGWEGFQRHVHMRLIGMNLLRLLDWKHRPKAEAELAPAA